MLFLYLLPPKKMKFFNLIEKLDQYFPQETAEEWDNTGLQAGDTSADITNILLALNTTSQVVDRAIETNCELIITHHPLFFREINKVNLANPIGKIIQGLINNDINLFTIHTNLDLAAKGTSWQLAQELGLNDLHILKATTRPSLYKLSVFVPTPALDNFRASMLQVGFGAIGNYSHCSFTSEGFGTFQPKEGASPAIGSIGETSTVKETKFETIFTSDKLGQVETVINDFHPYEQPAYDIFKLENRTAWGLGSYCKLKQPMSTDSLLDNIRQRISPPYIITNTCNISNIKNLGLIGGSGNSLINTAIHKNLDALIGGEFSYHNKITAADNGLLTIEIGHYASEFPAILLLKKLLEAMPNINVFIYNENQYEFQT